MGGMKYCPHKVGGGASIEELKPGDHVDFTGLKMAGKCHVIANNPKTRTIAIKEGPGRYWSSQFEPNKYAPPEVLILTYDGDCILRWSAGRKKEG